MNMQSIKDEMKKAVANRCKRAALGSIVRRNYAEIKRMNGEERIRFLSDLGFSPTYGTEISKELAGVEYDKQHGY